MSYRIMECKDTPNCGRVFFAQADAGTCPYCSEVAGILEIEGYAHA